MKAKSQPLFKFTNLPTYQLTYSFIHSRLARFCFSCGPVAYCLSKIPARRGWPKPADILSIHLSHQLWKWEEEL